MFIRTKTKASKNGSFRKSVQIVENFRENGKVKQKIVKHIGVAHSQEQLSSLKNLAKAIQIELENGGDLSLFTPDDLTKDILIAKKEADAYSDEDYRVDVRSLNEEARVVTGIHDIYGSLFDTLKMGEIIKNERMRNVFKNIVLARIANPNSKMATVERLSEEFGIRLELSKVYRMMDELDEEAVEKLNTLSLQTTKKLFNDKIDVIYFDATTLYFESFTEDEGEDAIRKNGYSKDLKFNQPQVVLALMVTKEGLPVGYEAFRGDTFDGHTLIPSLQSLKKRYEIDKVVYVADSGMFNKNNLEELEILEEEGLDYIVGARIKNLGKKIKEQILDTEGYHSIDSNTRVKRITLDDSRVLIVTHSQSRAKKDYHDRLKGIEKLRKKLKNDTSVKSHLSNQGYKKYLILEKQEENTPDDISDSECDIHIRLNESKIKADVLWDGLKGLIINANCRLNDEEIITQYANLWQVEESFRITKHDLKIRPIYHYKPQRVRAHLAISYAAYMLMRYVEHRIRVQFKKLSPARIRNLLLGVQTSIMVSQQKKIKYGFPSASKVDTKRIYHLMGISYNRTPYIIEKLP